MTAAASETEACAFDTTHRSHRNESVRLRCDASIASKSKLVLCEQSTLSIEMTAASFSNVAGCFENDAPCLSNDDRVISKKASLRSKCRARHFDTTGSFLPRRTATLRWDRAASFKADDDISMGSARFFRRARRDLDGIMSFFSRRTAWQTQR